MTTRNETWDIFLSYPKADELAAEALYEILSEEWRVFMDKKCLLPGADWDLEIPRAQAASLVTLILVSESTPSAYYERSELATAIRRAREKPSSHRVVPVLLSSSSQDLPLGIELKQAISIKEDGGLRGVAKKLRLVLDRVRPATVGGAHLLNLLKDHKIPTPIQDSALEEHFSGVDGIPAYRLFFKKSASEVLTVELYASHFAISWPSAVPLPVFVGAFQKVMAASMPPDSSVSTTAIGLYGEQQRNVIKLKDLRDFVPVNHLLSLFRLDIAGTAFIGELFSADSNCALKCGIITKIPDVRVIRSLVEDTHPGVSLLLRTSIWSRLAELFGEQEIG